MLEEGAYLFLYNADILGDPQPCHQGSTSYLQSRRNPTVLHLPHSLQTGLRPGYPLVVPGRPVGICTAVEGFQGVASSLGGCPARATRPYRCYPYRREESVLLSLHS